MKQDAGDFLLSVGELAALGRSFGVLRGPLSLLPTDEPTMEDMKNAAASLKKLPGEVQADLKIAVLTLSDPGQVARFHHAVADESITRSLLAWPVGNSLEGGNEVTCVSRLGNNRRISLRSPWELVSILTRLLAADSKLRDMNFGAKLSSQAVLTLLGIFDQLQRARLYSMLVHASPVDSVSPAEIHQLLAESEVEDFRWVLPFVEKVLPTGLVAAITGKEVSSALVELASGSLIEAVDKSGSLYQLTDNGLFGADAVFHNLSRAAICVSSLRPDGAAGYEMLVFLRGPAALFLYDASGSDGMVMTVTPKQLEDLLLNLFSAQALQAPPPPEQLAVHIKAPAKGAKLPPPPETLN
jgi:hypothetical protein